ncbi:hypothetical protein [Salinibacter altiplanensis]|uniref:hypothetical protein n=1 Tax=Salinibacter altiplanensis TaxID=1803181 RepID=UPI000C9F8440|nr:hypothetical protein [Salinibacter altiplanensis]
MAVLLVVIKRLLLILVVMGDETATDPGMEAVQAFVHTRAADRIGRGLGAGALANLSSGAGSVLGGASVWRDRRV